MNWIKTHKNELQEIANAYATYMKKAELLTKNGVKYRMVVNEKGHHTLAIDTSTIPIEYETVEAKIIKQ